MNRDLLARAGSAAGTLGVEMHGVRLNVRCDYDALLSYVDRLLDSHIAPAWDAPDLEVNAYWITRPPEEDPGPFDRRHLDGFGKRMFLDRDVLVWPDTHRNRDLQLRFRRSGERTVFDVAYRYLPKPKKLAKYPDYEQKRLFELLRYLVLFPIAWHLERTRGWVMVHSAAVTGDRGAVLIAGPGGAGKTTTCMALMSRAGLSLVSENLLFWDGERAHPVFEPIRLTEESLRLLGPSARELHGFGSAGALKHKSMFLPQASALPPAVRPAALFLPRFSRQGFARRIHSDIATELLVASNRLTLELNDFYWYCAALDVLWPRADNALAHLRALRSLATRTPCYSLGIDRAAGVDPVVRRIMACLEGSLEAPELGEENDS